MRSVKAGERAPNMLIEILKGGLLASVLSVALIVLYAFLLWKEILPAGSMPIVNAAIKVISAAAAALLAVRRCAKRRWLYGAAAGLLYAVLAFMVFSILSDTFVISAALLSDFGMGILSGMLSAMAAQVLGK
ncbi:MAG: TIGR04086 family membrane protein [Christensenellales bacterium]